MEIHQTSTSVPRQSPMASYKTIQRQDLCPNRSKIPQNRIQARKTSVSCQKGVETNHTET